MKKPRTTSGRLPNRSRSTGAVESEQTGSDATGGAISTSSSDNFGLSQIAKDQQIALLTTSIKSHYGPLPPVEIAQGYEELYPGAIQRMFEMAERDQQAYIIAKEDQRRRDDKFRFFGFIMGAISLLAILAAASYATFLGYTSVAISFLALGALGIASRFIDAGLPAKETKQQESMKKTK